MKIMSRTEFMALPPNTVYCEYSPCIFNGISIKGRNCGDDFFTTDISPPPIDCENSTDQVTILESGKEFKLDFNAGGRDGCFVEDQLFAVFDQADLRQCIARLQECLHP